jgi:hypothetical protein
MSYDLMMDGLCNPAVRLVINKRTGQLEERPRKRGRRKTKARALLARVREG